MPSALLVDHRIVWEQSARTDLLAHYDWIADLVDPDTAFSYTSRVEAFVEKLRYFPNRGTPRFGLARGLRTVTFERRLIIGYRVEGNDVIVLRVIHGARDFATAFKA